jgi:hypothetical protein
LNFLFLFQNISLIFHYFQKTASISCGNKFQRFPTPLNVRSRQNSVKIFCNFIKFNKKYFLFKFHPFHENYFENSTQAIFSNLNWICLLIQVNYMENKEKSG